MAKRARGTGRPGQRRPIERRTAPARPSAPAPEAAPRPSGLTEAELSRAAQLETAILAEERAAEQARARTRARASVPRESTPAGGLAVRAEQEYAYVARDVKDIIRIAAILFTTLLGLWILIDVAKVVTIT